MATAGARRPDTTATFLPLQVRAILLRSRDDWEWIDEVPKVKLFKEGLGRERSITVAQAETLVSELPAHQRDVLVFALATGLRQSNVLGLEWSHVDLAARHTWASGHRQSGTPTHELPRRGGWRSSVMVERYAHLSPDRLAKAAGRLDSLFGGYDLATPEKAEG